MTNIKLQKIVVAVGCLLLLIKFSAYLLTQSNAILTDALESIANVVASSFGLYSLILASKPKDENHPYGHGKIEFISASIEGSMIFLAGGVTICKSVFNFFYPNTVHQIGYGILLISFAGIINYLMGWMMVRRGEKSNSITLIAGGKHLQSDGWTTAGLLTGLGFIYFFKFPWLDSAIAIVFGLYICYEGWKILRKSVAGIMDEADTELLQTIITTLSNNRRQNWIDIHNLRIIKYGSTLHIDCHLTVPYYFSVKEGHFEMEQLENFMHTHHKNNTEWFVHVDACVPPAMCMICLKTDCKQREAVFKNKMEWTLDNMQLNRKHNLD